MTIVLVGHGNLRELELLADAAEERGGEALVRDVREWPGETPLTIRADAEAATLGTEIDYGDVTGVYVDAYNLFRPYEPRFHDDLAEQPSATFSQVREHRGMFESLSRIFEYHGATVIPPLPKQLWQDRKPWQLHRYEQAGLPIPDTLFTNDPDEVEAFFETYDRVIYKPVTRGGSPHVMTDEDLTDEALSKLATAPVQFQEFVEGDDLRIYVLDGEIVGAARYESEQFSFKLDMKDDVSVDVHPVALPEAVEETVLQAADLAELTFAAADVRLREDGSHSLIELNEAPRFAAPDLKADQNVAGALAEYLLDPN